MTCFWTDLVGATQQCEDAPVSGRRLRIGGEALSPDPPATALAIANVYVTDFATTEPSVLFRDVSVDQSGDWLPGSAASEYQSIAVIGFESALGAPFSVQVPATTVTADDRFATPADVALVTSASLTVVSAAIFGEWACGTSEFNLTTYATPTASVAYVSPGVLEFSMTDLGAGTVLIGTASGGFIYSGMLRVTGTVTDENGGTLAVDFWARFDYDGCF